MRKILRKLTHIYFRVTNDIVKNQVKICYRYNAVPAGKDCVKCKYRTFDFSNSLPLALRRQGFGGHPSPAPLHSAYFCKQKKSTDSNPYGLPSVALAKDGGGGGSRTRVPTRHDEDVYMLVPSSIVFRPPFRQWTGNPSEQALFDLTEIPSAGNSCQGAD